VKSSADRSVDGGVAAIFVIPKNLGVAGDSAMADDPTFAVRLAYQRRMMKGGTLRIRAAGLIVVGAGCLFDSDGDGRPVHRHGRADQSRGGWRLALVPRLRRRRYIS
jgi:hypothetical protein